MNIITNTDSYKSSHYLQYPKDTQIINSYIESRGVSKDSPLLFDVEIVHFGLQMFLKEYLSKEITSENIREAEELFSMHGVPFNRAGWETILNKHGGYLPVRIEALAEGTPVPIGTTQVQVQNTDPELPWLTSYLETSLLRSVWYPSTVATISREVKKVIYKYLKTTSDDPDGQIQFKLHDFGARGVSSEESAMIGGCAHIVNFMGTDTISGIIGARKYYHATMPAFSIPAAEHSTITSWGQDNEVAAYRNMLTQFAKPNSLLAVVSDSYNIYHAAEQIWGVELKQQVLDSGATVVIRPDSGNPVAVVLSLLRILGERFGFTTNKKGYKVLHPSVRIIQGDGVNYNSINQILREMWAQGWAADNLTFGMGGALLQKLDRDTFKYAMKANARFDGKTWHDVYKEPITDSGKQSKRGILAVVKQAGVYQNIRACNVLYSENQLIKVFENGQITKEWDFDTVRVQAKI